MYVWLTEIFYRMQNLMYKKIILQAFNQKTMTLYDSYVTLQKILRGGFQRR